MRVRVRVRVRGQDQGQRVTSWTPDQPLAIPGFVASRTKSVIIVCLHGYKRVITAPKG